MIEKLQWALYIRYLLRFFDRWAHETTYAYIENKHFFTKSCHHQTYHSCRRGTYNSKFFWFLTRWIWCKDWVKVICHELFSLWTTAQDHCDVVSCAQRSKNLEKYLGDISISVVCTLFISNLDTFQDFLIAEHMKLSEDKVHSTL